MFLVLTFDSIMGTKRKCESDSKAEEKHKGTRLEEKMKILDKLRCGKSTAAVGLSSI
jgi:hypothetical protein